METEPVMYDTKKLDSNKIEINLNGQKIYIVNPLTDRIVNPLNDHDYTYKNDSLLPLYRIPSKKQIGKQKITNIKAVHNCKICGYNTMNQNIMSKHMKLHESIKPGTEYIPCSNCSLKKINGYQKCPDCSFTSKNLNSLKLHMRIHTKGTPYKCTECKFSGKDLKELIKHYNEVKTMRCNECTFATHVPEMLLRHQQKHDGTVDV